jgi:hypothetical protein
MNLTSTNSMSYPNWQNDAQEVNRVKQPQYPHYSLPFRGSSSYKLQFTPDQI